MNPANNDAARIAAPLSLWSGTVLPEWIDYNGHMNVAWYVRAFDLAVDELFDYLGLGEAYRVERNGSTFAVEAHITYPAELGEGEAIEVRTRVLGHDRKRLHHFHEMYRGADGSLAATAEWMSLHVDMTTRRVVPMPDDLFERIGNLARAQGGLPRPAQAGSVMAIPPARPGSPVRD